MSVLTEAEFRAFGQQGYTHVPVTSERLADLDTPLSAYLKLARGKYSYLLESAQGGERWGRYSFIGLPARTVIRVSGTSLRLERDGVVVEAWEQEDPLNFVAEFEAGFRIAEMEGLPRFFGGLVGYFGYDTVRYLEPKLQHKAPPDPIGVPDILLMVSTEVVVFDSLTGSIQIIVLADVGAPDAYAKALERVKEISDQLDLPLPSTESAEPPGVPIEESDFVSIWGREGFMKAVERVCEYERAGDAMQVVIAQRMSVPFVQEPVNLYRALRRLNPSSYMFFMEFGDFEIVSSSPEIMVRVEDGEIVSRPLAGTRPRGHTEAEDLALEAELLADPKELAEHLMLIDLHRNDVGRVSQTGSVRVTEEFVIERYSHVMHISSEVRGQLLEGKTAMDVLQASLPVGTLSGAPKFRAMQIIDELEPVKRGIYGGAVGYLAFGGNMDTAIAIRTALIKDEVMYIQAGSGIVVDSKPEAEWEESMNKGRALFRAAAMAQGMGRVG